jgi:hypothetical protein
MRNAHGALQEQPKWSPAWSALVLNRDLCDEKLVAADITDNESEGARQALGVCPERAEGQFELGRKWVVNVAFRAGSLLQKLVWNIQLQLDYIYCQRQPDVCVTESCSPEGPASCFCWQLPVDTVRSERPPFVTGNDKFNRDKYPFFDRDMVTISSISQVARTFREGIRLKFKKTDIIKCKGYTHD